jgi:hypothetical protein
LVIVAIIMSVISLVATVRLHGQPGRGELHLMMLVLSLAAFVFQLVVGLLLVISPGNRARPRLGTCSGQAPAAAQPARNEQAG